MDEVVVYLRKKLTKAIGGSYRLEVDGDGKLNSLDDQVYISVSDESKLWKKRSIYRVPYPFTDMELEFTPKVVSFGPYHHGRHEKLKGMEEHKIRALGKVLKRSGKVNLEGWLNHLKEMEPQLRDHYDQLELSWFEEEEEEDQKPISYNKFIQMMLLDGCFMLEVLRWMPSSSERTTDSSFADHNEYYSEQDPIFSTHGKFYVFPLIRRDMYLLENQLPLLLLEKLVAYEDIYTDVKCYVRWLVLKFFLLKEPININDYSEYQHVLDIIRRNLVSKEKAHHLGPRRPQAVAHWQTMNAEDRHLQRHSYNCNFLWWSVTMKKNPPPTRQTPNWVADYVKDARGSTSIRTLNRFLISVERLKSAGIHVKASKTYKLNDISFDDGVLSLPPMLLDNFIQRFILNIMAFERCHIEAGKEVTKCVYIVTSLVTSVKDLEILMGKGIIYNFMPNLNEALKVFHVLDKFSSVELDNDTSNMLAEVLTCYRNRMKWWRRASRDWRSIFCRTYFNNPWTFTSLCGAVILLGVTTAQTVFTILQYYSQKPSK